MMKRPMVWSLIARAVATHQSLIDALSRSRARDVSRCLKMLSSIPFTVSETQNSEAAFADCFFCVFLSITTIFLLLFLKKEFVHLSIFFALCNIFMLLLFAFVLLIVSVSETYG